MKYIYIVLILIIAQSCSTSSSNLVTIDNINFTIPSGFDRHKPDKDNDEILKMMYKNEMYIIVQDNLGEVIKKYNFGDKLAMNMVHGMKFSMLQTAYNGYNESEKKNYKINGREITEQEFEVTDEYGETYYKYYIVQVTGNFLEVIISGKTNLRSEQVSICEEFIRNIDSK